MNMKSLLLLAALALSISVQAEDDADWQLGPVGGTFRTRPGTNLLEVKSVAAGGPAATAGLRAGDFIYGAFGEDFAALSTSSSNGYKGSVQDYGDAIERAEAGNVPLPLKVLRPGTGTVAISVALPNAGAFGAAYPLGSPKFDAMYEWACAQMHTSVQASGSGFSYDDGWFGMCLLAHPNWNDTTGAKPFRLSINKLRDWGVTRLTNAVWEPVESAQAGYVDSGLENWALSMDAMFLSEYRRKTGDASVNATIQRAAELLANRVQYWQQPDTGNGFTPNKPGIMGHGGVVGDYLHLGYGGGINIINAHVYPAMAMLKNAGANFSGNSGTTAGASPQTFTFEARARMSWNWQKTCTTNSGNDSGNVGYIDTQGGGDSSGRTAGAIAGFLMFNHTAPTADDTTKLNLMKGYLPRQWQRVQHAHAYTVGGVNLYQMALPFLPDRDQRFIMENTRYFYHLHRKSDGTLGYFGGRDNNGGDGYLDFDRVKLLNTAFSRAVASGNLPSFPQTNVNRLYSRTVTPWTTWATQMTRTGKINAATVPLTVEITDYQGTPLTSGLTAAWTRVAGPGTVNFSAPAATSTNVTFSADGVYDLQLVVSRNGYTLTEPYQFTVVRNPVTPPAPLAPAITVQPSSASTALGGAATFSVTATGDGPLLYQWRLNGTDYWGAGGTPSLSLANTGGGMAGTYQCTVTGPGGSVTSATALLTVSGTGSLVSGGLWRDKYEAISGGDVDDLTAVLKFPRITDSSGVINIAEVPTTDPDTGSWGQRWTGWVHVDVTGSYRFLATADDEVEVWISTDEHTVNKTKRVTANYNNADYRVWATASASAYATYTAGRRYYMEVRMKEAGGVDGCAVIMQKNGDARPANGAPGIPGTQLEYMTGGMFSEYLPPQFEITSPASDPLVIPAGVGLKIEGAPLPGFSPVFAWTLLSGPGNVTFDDTTTLTTGAVFSVPGVYVLQCTGTAPGVPSSTVRQLVVHAGVAPVLWSTVNVGTVPAGTGFSVNAQGVFSITAGGAGIDSTGTADDCVFVSMPVSGDVQITARVVSVQNVDGSNSRAGVMLRDGSDPGAMHAFCGITSLNTGRSIWRTATAGTSANTQFTGVQPSWVRLVRTGNAVQAFRAVDSAGTPGTWTAVGAAQTVLSGSGARAGLAATSSATTTGAVVMDNVSIIPLPWNTGPLVAAGADASVPLTHTLVGSASDDGKPAAAILTTAWERRAGPGSVSFANAASPASSATFSATGGYLLRLTASDGAVKTFDDVLYTVTSNLPVISAIAVRPAAEYETVPGLIRLSRTGSTASALTVSYSLGGTATADSDFTPPGGSVTFATGTGTVDVGILPLNDAAPESTETITLTITPQAGVYLVGASSTASIDLTDDDTISIAGPAEITIPVNVGLLLTGTNNAGALPAWTQSAGPAGVVFDSTSALINGAVFPGIGRYDLRWSKGAVQSTLSVTVGQASPFAVNRFGNAPAGTGFTYAAGTGTYSLTSGGTAIGSNAVTDQFVFLNYPLTGDARITARVVSIGTGGSTTSDNRSGVMIRSALSATAPQAFLALTKAAATRFITRATDSAASTSTSGAGAASYWLRLSRTGDNFSAEIAPDTAGFPGTWSALGAPVTIAMPTAYIGLAGASGSSGTTTAAVVIDRVTIATNPDFNVGPLVMTGPDVTITAATTSLTATVGADAGTPTLQWVKASGPGGVAFTAPASAATDATFSSGGLYQLRLLVSDPSVTTFDTTAITYNGQTPWQAWQAAQFNSVELSIPSISGPAADPDNDGLHNILEYALGTPPKSAGPSPLTATTAPGGAMTLRFTRNPAATDVALLLESGDNLLTWNPVSFTPAVISTQGGIQTVEVTLPGPAGLRRFLRLRAQQ